MPTLPDLGATVWTAVVLVTVVGGFTKGATGFAMPLVMMSGLSLVVAPELALAALILPTLTLNVVQALRNGAAAAVASAREHGRYLVTVLVGIAASAQLVAVLPGRALMLVVGVPVTLFTLVQLAGVRFRVPPRRRRVADVCVGAFAGAIGGMTGIWGPPTVIYLTALGVAKAEHLRVQGIVYGAGSFVLFAAHLASGILTAETIALSASLVLPGLVGIWLGFQVVDRLDQRRFRQVTLAVLMIAGLNLVRRGLFV